MTIHRWTLCVLACIGLLTLPASAMAEDASGGAAAPDPPAIAGAVCEEITTWECARGATLALHGVSLSEVVAVRFSGGPGRRDDRVARPRKRTDDVVEVVVPLKARSGPVVAKNVDGIRARTDRAVRILPRLAIPVAATGRSVTPFDPSIGVFPIKGKHKYGTETNHFGGGRGHQGEDVFAKCGTPLVAAFDSTVQHVAYQSRAGNYVVLQTFDGQSFAYMHLQEKAMVKEGDTVIAGQQVGKVGDTGRATGCHLHFEQWTAPGWYEGGEAIDPLPLLKLLDKKD